MNLKETTKMVVKFNYIHYLKDWWQVSCPIICISCIIQVRTEETSAKTTCDECGGEQYVVRPSCDKEDPNQRFSVKMDGRYTECCDCKSVMIRISCCILFQSIQQLDNNLFECLKCKKIFHCLFVSKCEQVAP